MSLADFFKLTDDKLADTHKTPEFDAVRARKPILAAIDKANEQYGSTEPPKGRKAWSVNRGVVEFSLPVALNGKSIFYLPAERFPDGLKMLKAAIEAGEADAELEKQANGETPAPNVPKRRNNDGDSKPRAGWTPERRAKMAEVAAKKRATK